MSAGSSPGGVSTPASSSSTLLRADADRRLASTQPAEPAPDDDGVVSLRHQSRCEITSAVWRMRSTSASAGSRVRLLMPIAPTGPKRLSKIGAATQNEPATCSARSTA